MERLDANRGFVKSLCKCKGEEEWKKRMRKAKPDEIKTIVDLVLNVAKKNVPICPKKAKLIMQNKKFFRHLLHPSYSLRSKKHFLIQKGGAIGGFLGSLLGGVGRMASSVGSAAARVVAPSIGRAASSTLSRSALSNMSRAALVRPAATAVARSGSILTRGAAVGRSGMAAVKRLDARISPRFRGYVKSTGTGSTTSSLKATMGVKMKPITKYTAPQKLPAK